MMPLVRHINVEVQTLLHTTFMDLIGVSLLKIFFQYVVVTDGSTFSCFQL